MNKPYGHAEAIWVDKRALGIPDREIILRDSPWRHIECRDALYAPHDILRDWPKDGWQDGRLYRKFQRIGAGPLLDQLLELGAQFRVALRIYGDLYPVALYVEDDPGYRIRPHTDCAGKVLSSQIYLGDGPESAGVVLLGNRYNERQIPYRMNYGYAFAVSDKTWHEVKPCKYVRKSIQLIYYDTPNPQL